jgi:mannose-6-phosphate isomerase-like protein (cupin superfamily)
MHLHFARPRCNSNAGYANVTIDFDEPGALRNDRYGDDFSCLVHHPLAPRTLAAPLHLHHREDEFSFVLRGRLGALLGDKVVIADEGNWVFKPRGQWHSFWNPEMTPSEIIEVISPAGFENYFRELTASWPDREKSAERRDKYQLEMDIDSVADLCGRFDLVLP